MTAPDPILIPCEGTGCPTHEVWDVAPSFGMCQTCGHVVQRADDRTAVAHDRNDILAMINRGDFDQ